MTELLSLLLPPSPVLGIQVLPTLLAAIWADLKGRTPTSLPIGAQVQGSGQSAAFPSTPFLGYLLLETSISEHVGTRGLGIKGLLERVVLIQEGLAGGIKEQRPARDWPSLPVSTELPGPICREYIPLSHPYFLCPDLRSLEEGLSPGLYSGLVLDLPGLGPPRSKSDDTNRMV